MLIHGAWQTARSWDQFQDRYEARGLKVLSPAWPFLAGPVERLRQDPPRDLRQLGLREIVDGYVDQIAALDEPPILIGHGFGGLVVQLLLDRGFGACGVAIDPVSPRGIFAFPFGWEATLPVLTVWNGWNRVFTLSYARFAACFAQTLPPNDKMIAYARHIVPTPGRIFFQRLLGLDSRVNYANPARPPLLLIAGENDRVAPLSTVRRNARRQQRAASRTDLQLFTGRSHWLCNEPGWEEVADFACDWALANARVVESSP